MIIHDTVHDTKRRRTVWFSCLMWAGVRAKSQVEGRYYGRQPPFNPRLGGFTPRVRTQNPRSEALCWLALLSSQGLGTLLGHLSCWPRACRTCPLAHDKLS